MKTMKKIVVGGLAVIGGLVVVCLLGFGFLYWLGKGGVPDKTILEVDFERGIIEYVPDDPIARFMLTDVSTLWDVVEGLERASVDDRVVALVARVGSGGIGVAQIQELRDAILAFRNKGHFAVAYAETFGEFGPGNGAYYLGTAFDEIYLQPSGDLGLTGLMAESMFFRGTFEKLGIVPRIDHRHEYKTFANIFTERKYTEPHREAVQRVVESIFDQIVSGISEARRLSREEVRGFIDQGPFYGQEALDSGFVDELAYRDEVYENVKAVVGKEAKTLDLREYLERAGRPHAKGEQIALIYGVGAIQRGESKYNPASGSLIMGSDTVRSALRAAIEDKDVKAIILRVDSPGGSYVASDAIWHETLAANDAGKPVVVSMGNVAGSGGYFVAMAADRIVAQPGTITGSIGVLGGKLVATDLLAKLGVSTDEVHTSENATMWTWTQDYTPKQWDRVQTWLDRVYKDFTDKVALGRGLPGEKVLEIAKGRIWTGEDAKELGLVDELGGLPVAIRLAREAAGIPMDASVQLKMFPEKRSLLKMLLRRRKEGRDEQGVAAALSWIFQLVQPVVRLAEDFGVGRNQEVLTMPEIGTEQ